MAAINNQASDEAPTTVSMKPVPMDVPPTPAAPYTCTKPLAGCEFLASQDMPVNLAPQFQGQLGGAFSFMCTLRMNSLTRWARVFDFSNEADNDSITAGVVESSNDFHFTIFEGSQPVSVVVPGFFEIGRDITLLCTVSPRGHMKVFKDGVLVGENVQGRMPNTMDRPSMLVGGHFKFHDQKCCGTICDAKVWSQEVAWPLTQQAVLTKLGNSLFKPGTRLLLEVVEEPGPHAGHASAKVYTLDGGLDGEGGLDDEGRWTYAGKVQLAISMDQDSKSSILTNFTSEDITIPTSRVSTATPTTAFDSDSDQGRSDISPRDVQK